MAKFHQIGALLPDFLIKLFSIRKSPLKPVKITKMIHFFIFIALFLKEVINFYCFY
jgi:hypothetical protein